MNSEVLVLATGGTIASTEGVDGATPSREGDRLLAGVPVDRHAEVTVEQVAQTPSAEMDFETVFELARRVRTAEDADGVVVLHGTDTMEETAYCLDLLLDESVPVVLTGAMRAADGVSPDGPANVLAAVRAAASAKLRESGGVYLALNDELHAARDVTKTHTSSLDTFASPGTGAVAELTPEGYRFLRAPGSRSGHVPATAVSTRVDVVASGLDADGRPLRSAVEAGTDGIVLEAFGVGNTTADIGRAVGEAVDAGVPVVLTSRCREGVVAGVYGSTGGSRTLHDLGVIPGRDLPAWKARIKLLLVTSHADDPETRRRLFAATGSSD